MKAPKLDRFQRYGQEDETNGEEKRLSTDGNTTSRSESERLMPLTCPSVHLFVVVVVTGMSWNVSSEGWEVCVFLRPPAVGVVGLVVHHQLVVHKVETV